MSRKLSWALGLIIFVLIAGARREEVFAGENKWTVLRKNVFKDSLKVLVVDPSNPKILYASIRNAGVLKSVNYGKSWVSKNNGLQNLNLRKIVIDPFRPRTIYACTDSGLYRSSNGGDHWEAIGFEPDTVKPGIPVNAVAMAQYNPDTLYAAIDTDIYRTRDSGKSWYHVPDTIHAIIHAIVVSRNNPRQLFVGTDAGVYKVQVEQDTIKILHDPNESKQKRVEKQRTIDLVVDPFHTKVIFALFEGSEEASGVFWVHENEWYWREMNNGFEKIKDFPLRSLSLDSNRPRTLYTVSHRVSIFAYEFTIPQIGILDFSSTALSTWEIAGFSQSLANELSKTHSVKWLSKSELIAIDSSLTFLKNEKENIFRIGKRFGFDIVVGGTIDELEGEQLQFVPKIAFVPKDSLVDFERDKAITARRYNYNPAAVDEVIDWIYDIIGGRPAWWVRYFLQDSRKMIGLGTLVGFGLGYALRSFGDNDDPPTSSKKLPLPPQFP